VLVALLLGLLVVAGWLAVRVGPAPTVELMSDRRAIGRATEITASFAEPKHGLGRVRLELVQGDRIEVLGSRDLDRGLPLPFAGDQGTATAVLTSPVGTETIDWLDGSEIVIRAVADRSTGWLRRAQPVVVERVFAVRLTPPRLELLSSQHNGRQGGAGAARYRVSETAVRSGVRAGEHVSLGAPIADGAADGHVVLYGLPWDLADAGAFRLFAEDDAGNRVELPFLDGFIARPPRTDTIRLSDAFLERVVPAIASQTPGFDASGSLLDQYLEINGSLRAAELERVAELSSASVPEKLWSEPFLQMSGSAKMAGFAETRRYLYDGREVDRQTHLGLDLASTARAPVPAPNTGRVVFAGWMTLYGNAVVIDHGRGLLSVSGHLSSIDVAEGDRVERGAIIGRSGATGLAGGDHLHLEIFVHGLSVDPVEWLDAKWIANNIASKLAGDD
jgi:murein DD-endopeptidase MepM/ murein hydrolase activator NlpD